MKAEHVQGFTRGGDPYRKLNLGGVDLFVKMTSRRDYHDIEFYEKTKRAKPPGKPIFCPARSSRTGFPFQGRYALIDYFHGEIIIEPFFNLHAASKRYKEIDKEYNVFGIVDLIEVNGPGLIHFGEYGIDADDTIRLIKSSAGWG